jgi:hypothetical protein
MFISEISRYKIPDINNCFNLLDKANILCLISFLYFIFITYNYLKSHDNIIIGVFYVLIIIFLVLFYVNSKLETNIHITNKYIPYYKLNNDLNTGDIVLFRTYEYGSLQHSIIEAIVGSLLYKKFYTHVGMIYKNSNGKLFIIETNDEPHYCCLHKKYVDGFQIHDYNKRIEEAKFYRIHIYKSNIYKYIDNNKLVDSINKYKNYYFFENGVYCINLITKILQENGVYKDDCIMPPIFDDLVEPKNYIYPIEFEAILVKQYND